MNLIVCIGSRKQQITEDVCKARQKAHREKSKSISRKYCKAKCERYEIGKGE